MFDPWVGKTAGAGNGNPLQDSCLENSIDRGAWQATDRRVSESQTGQSTADKIISSVSTWTQPLPTYSPSLPVSSPSPSAFPSFPSTSSLVYPSALFTFHLPSLTRLLVATPKISPSPGTSKTCQRCSSQHTRSGLQV